MALSSVLDMRIDESVTLRPTRILYVVPRSGWAKYTQVLDLTTQLHEAYIDDITPELQNSAKRVATAPHPPPPLFTLTSAHWYSSSRLTASDSTGAEIADWHSPIKGYGVTRIKFPEHSLHCSHPLEVKPLSIVRRAQGFVKDSQSYVWEAGGRFKSGCMSLFKAVAGKKFAVARYESDTGGFSVGGLLVLETREVNDLVALLTCMAVLNQRDAFYKPGLDLSRG